jgi:glycosyltransferase involved in cell wall biosynthesis
VIATDLGEPKEIIRNGENGYLISPGDVDTLAEKTLNLLQKPDILAAFSDQAQLTAKQYSIQSYVQKLQDLYTEIVIDSVAPSQILTKGAK